MRSPTLTRTLHVLALALLAVATLPAAHADDGRAAPTVRVETRELDEVYAADAFIEAVQQATLAAQINGSVTAYYVEAGDPVKKGQILARLDTRDTDAQVAAGRAGIAQAEAALSSAKSNYERTKSLVAQKFISQAALDKAESEYKVALAAVESARAGSVQATTARGFAEIRAPFDGIVTRRLMEVGEFASPGRAVIAVHDPASLRAVGSLPQFVLPATARVDRATVDIPSIGKVYVATRVTVLPAADPRLLSTQVRAELPSAAPGLTPGMAAKVLIPVGKANKRVIPEAALVRRGELVAVNVATPQGQPQLRQVRVGPSVRTPDGQKLVEVLAGLSDGEVVLLNPLAK
ncbi:MAG TPA: efflux RND transporter periplasmic adaptor subunit [Burkholderiaceae bacterium]|nr:efflux RND transporter periplasmic adaptor subunit [Burkholderiaceae bacterium]